MAVNIADGPHIVDEAFVQALHDDPNKDQWLFLEPHPEFTGHWMVQSFDPAFYFDLKDMIGPYRVVSPSTLDKFLTLCKDLGYQVAFFEDPRELMDDYEALNNEPDISLKSSLPGTVKGFLPYQVRGYNFLKDLDGGVALWSTGAGKTALASGLVTLHHNASDFDLILIVVKAHNKVNTQRMVKRLTGIESIVISGPKQRRLDDYRNLLHAELPIAVLNYEKFRDDKDALKTLMEDRRVFIVWDEPAKLKTRTTQLYKAVCECLYRSTAPAVDWTRKRPAKLQQIMLSATPIENEPEDFFNCVRLLDPRIYGTVASFRNEFVSSYSYFSPSKPSEWHNLDRMGLKAAHIIHEVDKERDPEIKAQFPEVIEEPYYIDWDSKHRKIYDLLTKKAAALDLEDANVLAVIGVLQMLCDAPTMVTNSAAVREAYENALEAWEEFGGRRPSKEGSQVAQRLLEALGPKHLTNKNHTKLDALKELLTETHPNEKALVFSAYNEGIMPILETELQKWGVSYVRYAGTPKQKQAAEDNFMADPDIQVFLSSDMGSDSLSLEKASVVVHYDLPWKWTTFTQRSNRIHRVTSEFDTVRVYTLMMADSCEDRKWEIIQQKQGYHDQIFGGVIADQSASAKLTKRDLWYILTGNLDEA